MKRKYKFRETSPGTFSLDENGRPISYGMRFNFSEYEMNKMIEENELNSQVDIFRFFEELERQEKLRKDDEDLFEGFFGEEIENNEGKDLKKGVIISGILETGDVGLSLFGFFNEYYRDFNGSKVTFHFGENRMFYKNHYHNFSTKLVEIDDYGRKEKFFYYIDEENDKSPLIEYLLTNYKKYLIDGNKIKKIMTKPLFHKSINRIINYDGKKKFEDVLLARLQKTGYNFLENKVDFFGDKKDLLELYEKYPNIDFNKMFGNGYLKSDDIKTIESYIQNGLPLEIFSKNLGSETYKSLEDILKNTKVNKEVLLKIADMAHNKHLGNTYEAFCSELKHYEKFGKHSKFSSESLGIKELEFFNRIGEKIVLEIFGKNYKNVTLGDDNVVERLVKSYIISENKGEKENLKETIQYLVDENKDNYLSNYQKIQRLETILSNSHSLKYSSSSEIRDIFEDFEYEIDWIKKESDN